MSIQLHGKPRRANADLNLVPYIDLLTCMIAFLLITAVWTQVVGLRAQQQGDGCLPGEATKRLELTVAVSELGFNVGVDDRREIIPRREAGYDFAGLKAALAKLKGDFPDQEEMLVASEDSVVFDTLVNTMDTVIAAGFPAVSLADRAGL